MMSASNPYENLGLDVTASQDTIKKQYLKLAKQYHPDMHGENEYFSEKFSLINQAYSLLSNTALKTQYDAGKIDMSGKKQTPQAQKTQSKNTSSFATGFLAKTLKEKNYFLIDLPFIIAAIGDKVKIRINQLDKSFILTIPAASDSNTILKIPKAIKSGLFKNDFISNNPSWIALR